MKKRAIKLSRREWRSLMRIAESVYIPELVGMNTMGSGVRKVNELIFAKVGYSVGDKVRSEEYLEDSPFEVMGVNEDKTLNLFTPISGRMMNFVNLYRYKNGKLVVGWDKER